MFDIDTLLVEIVYVFTVVLDPKTIRLLVRSVPEIVAAEADMVPTVILGVPERPKALEAMVAEFATPARFPMKIDADIVDDPAFMVLLLVVIVPTLIFGVPSKLEE